MQNEYMQNWMDLWEVKIIHIYREANKCADMLANMGSECSSGIEFFANPPFRVMQIVRDDLRGVSVPRLISKWIQPLSILIGIDPTSLLK
jgi:hypothetical protein